MSGSSFCFTDAGHRVFVSFLYVMITLLAPNMVICGDMESAFFTTVAGCENAMYMENPFKHFQASSRTQCAMKCLSNPECSSIGMLGDASEAPQEVYCLLYDSAAESCDELTLEYRWTYMRLQNYVGDKRETKIDEHQCSPWEMHFEIVKNKENGDKRSFLEALSEGPLVRIAVVLHDGHYHRLTPIVYSLGYTPAEEPIVYFEFAPRYYSEYVNGNNFTYKQYIGISTNGDFSFRTYSMADYLVKEESGELTAMFFTRQLNKDPDGNPTYYVNPSMDNYDITNLWKELNKGSAFVVHLDDGMQRYIMQDRWSRLDKKNHVLGIIKYEGALFSSEAPTFVEEPLQRQYRIATTDGKVKETAENSKIPRLISSVSSEMLQLWYADSCWELAKVVTDDFADNIYDTSYLLSKIRRGSSIRVQFHKDNLLTTKTVRRAHCDDIGCKAYFDDHPVLQETDPFEFNWNKTSYNGLTVSEIFEDSIVSFNTIEYTLQHDSLDEVHWFVDSIFYEEIFVMDNGKKIIEKPINVAKSGVNLQMVIIQNDAVTSLEIEEVIEYNNGGSYEFHTATVGFHSKDYNDFTAIRSKYILLTSPFSLTLKGWSSDWQHDCFTEAAEYTRVTVFASKQ